MANRYKGYDRSNPSWLYVVAFLTMPFGIIILILMALGEKR